MTAKEYLEQVRHKQAEIGNLKRDKEAVKKDINISCSWMMTIRR